MPMARNVPQNPALPQSSWVGLNILLHLFVPQISSSKKVGKDTYIEENHPN